MEIQHIQATAIIKELQTEGHSPLLIVGNDFKMYVAKNDKGKQPPFSLINEILSAVFLKIWKLQPPPFKLVKINEELLTPRLNLSKNHLKSYYKDLCFGSEFVENQLDVNNLVVSPSPKLYQKILNPIDVLHITLFDTWVENDDRKPNNYNLVFKPLGNKFLVVPIDQAFIFGTVSYQDLNPEFVAVSVNDHLLVSPLGALIKRYTVVNDDFLASEREYFYLRAKRCEEIFDGLFLNVSQFYQIDDRSIQKLKEFLFNAARNKKVFDEYVYRLQQ